MSSSLKYLKQILPNLYQFPVEFPFGPNSVKTHGYIIKRVIKNNKYENIMIYGSCHIQKCYDDIINIGGISRIYLNHRDEASSFHKLAYDLFKCPSYCHIKELEIIENKTGLIHNQNLFTFNYSTIHKEFDDFDIIHCPGHCPGATFYGWNNKNDNNKYYLFSGDSIYTTGPIGDYNWKLAPMTIHSYDGKYKDMINTLNMLKDIKFNYLIPGLYDIGDNVSCYDIVQSQSVKDDTLNSLKLKLGPSKL